MFSPMFSPKSPPMSGNCNYNCGGKCLEFAAKWFTFPGKNRLGMSIPDTDK